MAKEARSESHHADWLRAFSLVRGPYAFNPKDKTGGNGMKREARIISYRRRCRKLGDSTGLSHYILLTPTKHEKQDK